MIYDVEFYIYASLRHCKSTLNEDTSFIIYINLVKIDLDIDLDPLFIFKMCCCIIGSLSSFVVYAFLFCAIFPYASTQTI